VVTEWNGGSLEFCVEEWNEMSLSLSSSSNGGVKSSGGGGVVSGKSSLSLVGLDVVGGWIGCEWGRVVDDMRRSLRRGPSVGGWLIRY
jgi:hypothetical protein